MVMKDPNFVPSLTDHVTTYDTTETGSLASLISNVAPVFEAPIDPVVTAFAEEQDSVDAAAAAAAQKQAVVTAEIKAARAKEAAEKAAAEAAEVTQK